MMYFPHPVLVAGNDAYPIDAAYACNITAESTEDGVELELEHSITLCPDISDLISSGKLMFCMEIAEHGKGGYFRRISTAKIPRSRMTIPAWGFGEGRLICTARVIANQAFTYAPTHVEPEWQDLRFEILPGTVMALDQCEVRIFPDDGLPILEVASHHGTEIDTDFLRSRILLKLPEDTFRKLESIPEGFRDSRAELRMITLPVLVEALSKMRTDADFNQEWATRLRELFHKLGIDSAELTPDGEMSLMGLAEKLLDGPTANAIENSFLDCMTERD